MQLRLLKEGDRKRWDEYVLKSNSSNCYHLIGWKNIIEKAFGHKTYYLLAEQSSNDNAPNSIICDTAALQHGSTAAHTNSSKSIVGILPLVQLKSILFGNFMVSVPYFNYGGVCSDSAEVQQELLKEAIRIAEDEKAKHIELRHSYKFDYGLPEKTSKVSMILELPSKPDDLWKAFSSKLRSQIRRPEKEGMYARIGKEEELSSFYQVFSANMRDLGTPVYSKKFFRNILAEFPETFWICSVYTKDNLPVASGFLVAFKDRLEIPWASSLRDYNHLSPNMLLYWSVLKFACEKGYRIFDFGRSTPGEGTYKFKEQWGARPVQLYWHYWLRNGGPLPELNPDNPKYRLAIRVWQKLPVVLTRLLGPMIVRNLP